MRAAEGVVVLYVTAGSPAEAVSLGRAAVEAGLAACSNILPGMRSIYRWQGEIETSEEVVLLIKTTRDRARDCAALIERNHSYQTPCVLSFAVDQGAEGYLDWIAAACGDPGGSA